MWWWEQPNIRRWKRFKIKDSRDLCVHGPYCLSGQAGAGIKADYLQYLAGSDVIKAFKKGGPAPHHLTLKMCRLPHEPLTKKT